MQSQGRFFGCISRALNLNAEQQDIAAGRTWSQLRALNHLMQNNVEDDTSCVHIDMQILELVQKNPELAKCRFKIDDYEEFLLHQIICKHPSVELVVCVCQNVINLSVKSGESNGVSASTWNISTQQSWVSIQVYLVICKPHMPSIFHIGRQLGWKNIQMDE